jgi:hypothetical protein
MKRFITIALALAICAALVLPAMASAVPTQVVVTPSGSGPIIKCKWEVITSQTVGKADPCEAPQPGQTDFDVYAVVTDPDGYGDLSENPPGKFGEIYADIYHPNLQKIANMTGAPSGQGWCGSWKYQLELWRITDMTPQGLVNLLNRYWSSATVNAAWMQDMGLSTRSEAYDDIVDELIEGRAFIYKASGVIHNHEQPDGGYPVKIMGFDRHGDPSDVVLENVMKVPTKTSIYIDFNAGIDYGNVTQSSWTQVGGDYTLCTPGKPTVWNNGNTPVQITVRQDDMGFGYTGMTPPGGGDPNAEWNVQYAARLGNAMTGTRVEYWPNQTVVLPEVLIPCVPTKMDFEIHVIKANPAMNNNSGTWSGTLTVGPKTVGYPTCTGGG